MWRTFEQFQALFKIGARGALSQEIFPHQFEVRPRLSSKEGELFSELCQIALKHPYPLF